MDVFVPPPFFCARSKTKDIARTRRDLESSVHGRDRCCCPEDRLNMCGHDTHTWSFAKIVQLVHIIRYQHVLCVFYPSGLRKVAHKHATPAVSPEHKFIEPPL